MARFTEVLLAKRDDPIYKEGLTIYTPSSHRGSTQSTASSPKDTASPSSPASKGRARKAPPSNPGSKDQ